MVPLLERKGTPILGGRERAEKLVDWSIGKARPGAKFSQELAIGLTLHFIAAGNEPKVYIHWNPARHRKYLKQQGQVDRLMLLSYGVCIEHDAGQTTLRLLGAGESGVMLWDEVNNSFCQRVKEDDVNYLTGMVKFAENGPVFYNEVECQKELEVVTALAVVGGKKAAQTKPLEQVLPTPSKEGLSTNTKAYLLADSLMSELIKQAKGV